MATEPSNYLRLFCATNNRREHSLLPHFIYLFLPERPSFRINNVSHVLRPPQTACLWIVGLHTAPLISHPSSLYSLLILLCSLFSVLCSLFIVLCSSFIVLCLSLSLSLSHTHTHTHTHTPFPTKFDRRILCLFCSIYPSESVCLVSFGGLRL